MTKEEKALIEIANTVWGLTGWRYVAEQINTRVATLFKDRPELLSKMNSQGTDAGHTKGALQ